MLTKQLVALVLGILIAFVYRKTHGSRVKDARSLMATLVLLTLLISMISSVIGDNVARAFSLVGALSIVRFRTVVEDTRDTAFVILAVGVGMALGAGYLVVPLMLIPLAWLAAWLFVPSGSPNGSVAAYEVRVRLGLGVDDAPVRGALAEVGEAVAVAGASTVRQGTGIEMVYRLRLNSPATMLQMLERIQSLEGVGGVEISER